MTRVLTTTLLFALALPCAARAADLDAPYPLPPPPPVPYSYGGPYQRALAVPIPPSVLDEGLVVPPRPLPPVGGPYLYAPGLNGPYGPPVYPFLPFAFGYGY